MCLKVWPKCILVYPAGFYLEFKDWGVEGSVCLKVEVRQPWKMGVCPPLHQEWKSKLNIG